ncbi:MAG TPA: transporter substrate-binding domain-containing protein [Candidatus Limnocylindrales bacterium]|nr:transporter substrate-binding domain-containing protein [Candidatus Limnocylindrales bacterium]
MRARTRLALIPALTLALAACGGGATAAPTGTPVATATAAATAEPTPYECAPENLETLTAGRLTIGTDNPAFPPYFEGREGGNNEPWDPEWGDPTTGEGFESATAYAIATQLGYAEADVDWVVVPFTNSFAPGPKDFDFFIGQVTFNEERTQGADLSEGYYFGNQTVVVMEDSEFASATTITELKDAELGAQVGTTSLATIEGVIQTTPDAAVYNTTDDAIEAMTNGQIDGIVVDLPTAFFITNVQISGGVIVGQIGEAAGAQPEHFSLVLELDSPLTGCVNGAVSALADDGALDDLVAEWLPDASVPELQP